MNEESPAPCAGWVLAGGRSSRMGREKGLLEISGVPLVLRAARLLGSVCASATIIGPAQSLERVGLPVVPDDKPELGPLGGILTALDHTTVPWNLVIACDLPYLSADWLRYLAGRAARSRSRVVMPESDGGPEPLCAVYHRDAAAPIRSAIQRGALKVTRALEGLPIERVAPSEIRPFDPQGVLFQNLNTPEDYERARAELEG